MDAFLFYVPGCSATIDRSLRRSVHRSNKYGAKDVDN